MKLNGTIINLNAPVPLCEFLERQGYRSSHLAVELNGTVVAKEAYDRTLVWDGDTLEVVSFVGGG